MHWLQKQTQRGGIHDNREEGKTKLCERRNRCFRRLEALVIDEERSKAGGDSNDDEKQRILSCKRAYRFKRAAVEIEDNQEKKSNKKPQRGKCLKTDRIGVDCRCRWLVVGAWSQ
ncbi:MAG TPA: hypothetical protein DEF00_04380 [Candidatus Taylorbacteria bacterium]|nr:hypothetical protein [Candidatus Taylorbacteria bacterium]